MLGARMVRHSRIGGGTSIRRQARLPWGVDGRRGWAPWGTRGAWPLNRSLSVWLDAENRGLPRFAEGHQEPLRPRPIAGAILRFELPLPEFVPVEIGLLLIDCGSLVPGLGRWRVIGDPRS